MKFVSGLSLAATFEGEFSDVTRSYASKDSPLQWLLGCFSDVQRFMDRAASANDGVIVNIA